MFMPDWVENACSISCCSGERVGTGLEEGVGAGMAKALWISSALAFRTNSSSLTMHNLGDKKHLRQLDRHKITSSSQHHSYSHLTVFQYPQGSFIIYPLSHGLHIWDYLPNRLELYILPQPSFTFTIDLGSDY